MELVLLFRGRLTRRSRNGQCNYKSLLFFFCARSYCHNTRLSPWTNFLFLCVLSNYLILPFHISKRFSRLQKQKAAYRDGCLHEQKRVKLEEIGVSFIHHNEAIWHNNFELLSQYVLRHEDISLRLHDPKLHTWLLTQYRRMEKGKLSHDKVRMLKRVGEISEDPEAMKTLRQEKKEAEFWEEMFERLQAFSQANGGDANILDEGEKGDAALHKWAKSQRMSFKKGRLTAEKAARLELIGLDLDASLNWGSAKWERMYSNLADYKEEHGHVNVPNSYESERHGKLGIWVHTMRQKANGTRANDCGLSSSRRAKVST